MMYRSSHTRLGMLYVIDDTSPATACDTLERSTMTSKLSRRFLPVCFTFQMLSSLLSHLSGQGHEGLFDCRITVLQIPFREA